MGRKHFSYPSLLRPLTSYNKCLISQQTQIKQLSNLHEDRNPLSIDPSHHNETSTITTSCCSAAYRPPAPAAALQSLLPRAVRSSQRGPASRAGCGLVSRYRHWWAHSSALADQSHSVTAETAVHHITWQHSSSQELSMWMDGWLGFNGILTL